MLPEAGASSGTGGHSMKRLFPRLNTPEFERSFVLAQMPRPPFHRLRLERFPRGIGSSRIDVALDSGLVDATMALVKNILREDVRHYFWQQPPRALDVDAMTAFRRAYADNTRMVLHLARHDARPETAQLFQLAAMRLLLVVADQQIELLRRELEDARAHPSRQYSGQSLELHDRVVILARNEQSVRFRVLHDVWRVAMRLEDPSLRKSRKTLMGMSWPVLRAMLANPLLQLGGLGSNEDFFLTTRISCVTMRMRWCSIACCSRRCRSGCRMSLAWRPTRWCRRPVARRSIRPPARAGRAGAARLAAGGSGGDGTDGAA